MRDPAGAAAIGRTGQATLDPDMLTRTPAEAIAAPVAARISERVVLLLWQATDAADPSFRPFLGRTPLPPPHAALRLDSAGSTCAALLGLPRQLPHAGLMRLGADTKAAPAIAVEAIGGTPEALAATLPPPLQARLLGFLLEVGPSLFQLARQPAFLRCCRNLANALHDCDGGPPRSARCVAQLPGGRQLIVVPAEEASGAWHLLGAEAVRRVPAVLVEGSYHLLVRHAAAGDTLQQAGGGLPWRVVAPAGTVPHLLGWLRTAPPAAAAAVAAMVHAAACDEGADGRALASVRRELGLLLPRPAERHDDASAPVAAALEMALPDGRGGLFLRGWISDPHDLVASLQLRLPWREIALSQQALHCFARNDLSQRFARHAHGAAVRGFALHLHDVGGSAHQPSLVLRLGSGAEIHLVPSARALAPAASRDAVLASVPPSAADEALMRDCIGPAAARLHETALAAPRATEIVHIGRQPARSRVSVLIPLYRTLSFLRAQVASFACDPAWHGVETIFVLDSPEQRTEVEHLLRGLSLMHGLGFVLVVMPRNLGYAAANNEGAKAARGRVLLLLNSDVVPDHAGWLAPMLAALGDRGIAAAGPKLLFEDGSLQHAGLFFERDHDGAWFNRHYFKGMPRRFAPACRARPVPAVTGAAMLVRRATFEQVGGITEDYIIGDYEDSDFCLKLRAAGHEVAYVPRAELWHFERRSIRAHPGYTRGLASLYNRRLHHARWDASIAALMRGFARAAGA